MSINSVNSSSFVYLGPCSALSEETKRKLLALGIAPSTVQSEEEAKRLIAAATQNKVQQTINESNSQNTCSSELELLTRTKTLAQKLGVKVLTGEGLSEMIAKLSAKVDTLDNNKENDVYRAELTSIKTESETLTQQQNSMFTAMNVTANLNKFMLGLS